MHRFTIRLALGLMAVVPMSFARADAPATQPAKQPAAPPLDCSTPMAFMTTYDQLAGEDPAAFVGMY
jgi:hypothetical protein